MLCHRFVQTIPFVDSRSFVFLDSQVSTDSFRPVSAVLASACLRVGKNEHINFFDGFLWRY
ncbi:MAG: hypothetical protein CMJ80_09740 [Planctomycetaceae bacterium]|nr:hypothetical protein [Planctomycetaceae bacterium]